MKQPRLFVFADIGGPGSWHVGDEAMLEANLAKFRRLVPGIRFTVPSRDPDWTGSHYGVESLPAPVEWSADETVRSLRDCNGVVVSGGGNLSSTWPEKVLERAELITHAKELGIPVAVLGQTLGPTLTAEQRRLLSAALQWPAFIGVRDENSRTLALALGVPPERVHLQVDDAFFLEPSPVQDARADGIRSGERLILVTLDASFGAAGREQALAAVASQLDGLAQSLGASLVFVPHVGGTELSAGLTDIVAGRALQSELRSPLLLLDLWLPREVRWLAGQAAMIVSTRYHPLVFAAAAGVPALGIYTDFYTRTKLRGALMPIDLEGWAMPLEEAERGAFLPLAMELWSQRKTVERKLEEFSSSVRAEEERRWHTVCQILNLHPKSAASPPNPAVRAVTGHAGESTLPLRLLTEEHWRQYDEQGFLLLGKVLAPEQLEALRQRMDDIMLGTVCYPTVQTQLDTGGSYEDLPEAVAGPVEATLGYRKVQGLEVDPLVLDLIRRDLFREICARQYGKHASISIFRAMMMNKPSAKGTYLPWHQDAGDVWKLDRDPLVTIWTPLDAATRSNGCLQVIPGSHKLGLLSKNGSTVSQHHVAIHCPESAIIWLEMEAGEAVLLHNWLLHRSDINRTAFARRALTVCYMDGRTLNTLTGSRFPIVFGEREEAESALLFAQVIRDENRILREATGEAERYAVSLLDDNRLIREENRMLREATGEAERYAVSLLDDNRLIREENRMLREATGEAERYAVSLLDDNRRREEMRQEASRYAQSLEAELQRVRTVLAEQMNSEIA